MRRTTMKQRRAFTLIEVLISLVISSILLLGMGSVLVAMFTGMRQSKDFADATGRVDLIRQLTFDARTGDEIIFPASNGPGDYTGPGVEGDQVRFNALYYDPDTGVTEERLITWESVRSSSAGPDDPYQVRRWVEFTAGTPTLTFAEDNILNFDIERTGNNSFTANFSSEEGDEEVSVQLAVTLRNVVD